MRNDTSSPGPSGAPAKAAAGASPPVTAPKTSIAPTPAGRPLLHFSNYRGEVHSALTGLSGAINKLGAAVQKSGNIPQHEQVMAALRKAQTQAQSHLLDGAAPHERELSLALSAMTGG